MYTKQERIDIHRLVIPEAKKSSPDFSFDPAWYMNEGDWNVIFKGLEYEKKHGGQSYEAQYLRDLKLLSPVTLAKLNPQEPNYGEIEQALREIPDRTSQARKLGSLCDFAYVFPNPDIDRDALWSRYKISFNFNRWTTDRYFQAIRISCTFPEKFDQIQPDAKLWEELKRRVNFERGQIKGDIQEKVHRYSTIIQLASYARLIFSDAYRELAVSDVLDKSKWVFDYYLQDAKERDDHASDFQRLAVAIKIVSANKIWIDNNGPQFEMPKKPAKKLITPLPETRRY